MKTVYAKAPTRIDLLGGTLDLWPLNQILKKKATLNIAVDLCAQVEISQASEFSLLSVDQDILEKGDFLKITQTRSLPLLGELMAAIWRSELGPISLRVEARSPKGAGIGGSSSLAIAAAAGLFRYRFLKTGEKERGEQELLHFVQDLEAKLLRIPTGCQDYWGALRGGLNLITYPYGGVHVETLPLESFSALADRLLLVYSGVSRCSGINNWQIFKSYLDADPETVHCLEQIGELAEQATLAVKSSDWKLLFELSFTEWQVRKRLWPQVETQETQAIDKMAKDNGAYFSRVCGAGGGGVMVLFCDPQNKKSLEKKLRLSGLSVLSSSFAQHGLLLAPHQI